MFPLDKRKMSRTIPNGSSCEGFVAGVVAAMMGSVQGSVINQRFCSSEQWDTKRLLI